MKNKAIVVISLLFILALYLFPKITFAHVLESSGSIGIVLHIDPEDDPIAKEQSRFHLSIKDKQNKLTTENCNCIVKIYSFGKEIHSQKLFTEPKEDSLEDTHFYFTFPDTGVYKIIVNGDPLQKETFQRFSISYDIRIERTSDKASGFIVENVFIAVLAVFFVGGFAIILFIHKKKWKK